MPIHNEHTRKISMPHHQSYNEELEDDTPTPRRVPVVKRSPLPPAQQHYPQSSIAPKQESTWTAPARPIPAQRQYHQPPVAQPTWTPPARPMSAQQYQQQQAAVLSQQTTLPLPKPGSSSSVVGAGLAPALEGGDGFSSPRRSSMVGAGLAPALGRGDGFPSPRASRPKERRRPAIPILITLALLTILIAVGGFFEPNLLSPTPGQTAPVQIQTTHSGPFVQLPLNALQLNSLQHLVGYMKYKQLASMYVARMPLDVELGQLIMVEYNDDYYSADLNTMVNQLHAGGVIMYEFQMNTFNQTKHDIAEMQKHATYPLFIATDEEGGPYVHRLKNIYGPRMSATDIYNTGDVNVATQQGHKAAHDLLALGINENLTPDVDVNLVNGYDMVTRTFGNDPASVIKFAGAYMRAMQSDGVVACMKHYPGLGDALNDAHTGLPVVNRTKQQIYDVELAPFKYFIQSQIALDHPGMIMPTDVLMPAIDPTYPAELSHIFMTDILRKQFGYDGVVLTDALYMRGITQTWSMPEAAVLALNAGNDMLLGPNGTDQTIAVLNALKEALRNGTLSKSRVDEAATRIIALKMEDHLMPAIPPEA